MMKYGNLRRTIFFLLILSSTLVLIRWHGANYMPSGHDSLRHMETVFDCYYAFNDHPITLYKTLRIQPARYMPLTYALGVFFLHIFNDSPWGFASIPVFFFLVSAIALWFLGKYYSRNGIMAAFPLLVFIGNPVTWVVFTSFNLEASLIAASTAVFCLLLFAPGAGRWLLIPVVMTVSAVLSLSKAVLLIPLAPAGLVLIFAGNAQKRTYRALVLAAVLGASCIWLMPRLGEIMPELAFDFRNPGNEVFQGWWYYPSLLLVGYRGLPLIAVLAVAIYWFRRRKSEFTADDIAMLLYFVAPIVFFSVFETKRPWYPLSGFIVLPVWYVHVAQRTRQEKATRRLSCVLLAFYFLSSVFNIAVVGLSHGSASEASLPGGILRPRPPRPIEIAVAEKIAEDVRAQPQISAALDLSKTDIESVRVKKLAYLKKGRLALTQQLTATDRYHTDLLDFFDTVGHATKVYTVGETWPVIDREVYNESEIKEPYEKLAAALSLAEKLYSLLETMPLPEGKSLSIFLHHDMKGTLIKSERRGFLVASKDQFDSVVSPLIAKQEGDKAFESGDYRRANEIYRLIVEADPDDCEYRFALSKSLSLSGDRPEARVHWQILFERCASFGMKIDALREIASLEITGNTDEGLMESYLEPLIGQNNSNPQFMYSLLSTRIYAQQLKGDWDAAIAAIGILRKYLTSDQTAGVNLQEALFQEKAGRLSKAEALLQSNLTSDELENAVTADSALHLARLQADGGRFDEALESMEKALSAKADSKFLATSAIHIANRMEETGRDEESYEFLQKIALKIDTNAAGPILVEIAKYYVRNGEKALAIPAFEKALKNIEDENIRDWIKEMIGELEGR